MENLILYGLFALVGLAVLRNLLPARPEPPQIVYVVAPPEPVQRSGCLTLFIAIIVILVALRLLGAV